MFSATPVCLFKHAPDSSVRLFICFYILGNNKFLLIEKILPSMFTLGSEQGKMLARVVRSAQFREC
jgi:hypothetical protein